MESIATFLADWHVRVGWVAFTTLWVFWGLTWFVRNAFGGDGSHAIQSKDQFASDPNAPSSVNPETGGTVNGTNVHEKKFLAAPSWSVSVFNRLNRSHDMLRDLVLMLLSVLSINTFARGSTRAVMILAWIFVAFAVVYFFVEASYEHRFLRLVYTLTFYAISLAIVGCAWHQGFFV